MQFSIALSGGGSVLRCRWATFPPENQLRSQEIRCCLRQKPLGKHELEKHFSTGSRIFFRSTQSPLQILLHTLTQQRGDCTAAKKVRKNYNLFECVVHIFRELITKNFVVNLTKHFYAGTWRNECWIRLEKLLAILKDFYNKVENMN